MTRRWPGPLVASFGLLAACSLGLSESDIRATDSGAATGIPSGPGAGAGSGSGADAAATGAGSGTGGSSTASGPSCGDGTCDAGETCASCADCACMPGQGCEADACVQCPATFRIDTGDEAGRGLTLVQGELYGPKTTASGDLGVVQIAACSGQSSEIATSAANGSTTGLFAAALGDRAVLAATFDDSPGDIAALVVGVDPGPAVAWKTTENGSDGLDSIQALAATSDRWIVAGSRYGSPLNWIVAGDADGASCSFEGVQGSAYGAAAAADGADLYTAATDATGIQVAKFHASDCDIATCSCDPWDEVPPLLITGAYLEAMLVTNGRIYLSGYASEDGSSYYGFLEARDPWTGDRIGYPYFEPASSVNHVTAFITLATDGDQLFAGGYRDSTSVSEFSSATGVILAFPLDDVETPTFEMTPPYAHACVGLAAEQGAAGALFAQLDLAPGATFTRLEKSTDGYP